MEKLIHKMTEKNNWVCWGKDGAPRKCPFNPTTDKPAKAGVPQTWTSFDTALSAVIECKYEGIGFELDGDITGIDFDNCISEEGLDPWVSSWVSRLNSYTEISPSGKGLHVFVGGSLPGAAVKTAQVELYDRARYFTVTGNAYGAPRPLRNAQEALNELYEEALANTNRTPQGANLAATEGGENLIAVGLSKDSTFERLWNGDRPNGNESADDLALFNKLAYWCNLDAQTMRQEFLISPHYQTKDEAHKKKAQREDYLTRSIRRAISDCLRTASEDSADYTDRQREAHTGTFLVKAADVAYTPPRWLIAPYFQRGKGTLVQGDNGSGKTAFMCAVIAHVTTGTPLLGAEVEKPGAVLVLSVEDDLPVLRGRIEADGGDLEKVFFLTNAAGLTFNSPEVERAIKETGAVMVLFDPFQAFLGAGVDMFKANETRPKLAKLFAVCEKYDCACAIIAHMSKNTDRTAVNRSLGSVDIPAAMRSILQLAPNPDHEGERVMVHVKCSNAPKGQSIAYTIGDRGSVFWIGYSDLTLDELTFAAKRKELKTPYEQEPLVRVFKNLLEVKPGGGFWSYSELREEGAKLLGYPPFGNLNELRGKLDNGLAKELQRKEGILVTHGVLGRARARGVRIERYVIPHEYTENSF